MASVTIRLIVDTVTKKKNVVISYESDADAMAMEHEQDHRRIVDQLIEGGALSAADLGQIVVERDQPSISAQETESSESATQRESLTEDN